MKRTALLACVLIHLITPTLSSSSEEEATVADEDCRDHPRLGAACKNVLHLSEWCQRSQLQSGFENNFAQICKATCGLCEKSLKKPIIESPHSPPEKLRPPGSLTVQLGVRASENGTERPLKVIAISPPPSSPRPKSTIPASTKSTTPWPQLPLTSPAPCGSPPDYKPCLPLDYSNRFFQQCCIDQGMSAACVPLCRYDVKVEQVQLAAARQQCPFSILPSYFLCASRTKNNTDCCRDTGILAQTGPQCKQFCDPSGGPYGGLGLKHLKCGAYLEEIMQCHWAGLR